MAYWRVLLLLALVCGLACGGKTAVSKGGVAGTGGAIAATGGSPPVGGSTGSATGGETGTGLTGAGGAASGGAGTGGLASGGTGTDGAASGGATGMDAAVSGGSGGGGLGSGGSAGAVATGGSGTGGAGTGAVAAGGTRTGGARTGGAGTGGARTGGIGAGGARTGGTGSGGATGGGTGGTPADATLDLDHTGMDFGAIALGGTAVATFTLTNRGASTSGVPSISAEGATYPLGTPNPVTVTGCSGALAPSASCVLTVSVTPPELGLFQAYVRITANPGIPSRLSIYVHGNAIGFKVSSPSSVDFGVLAPGALAQHIVTITALIALSDLEVYTGGENFSIHASASTCTATLAADASCVVTVDFRATTVGWKDGLVGFKAGGDTGQIVVVRFTANVSAASDLAIEPQAPPTYACVFQQTSPPVVFTVTNLSDAASGTITSAIVGDDYAGDFAISHTDCTTLAPRAACTISVVCNPGMSASAATRHEILSVTDGSTHLAVPLTGEVSFGS